jgi:hypothetical protein
MRKREHESLSRDIDERSLPHYRSPGINSLEFRFNSVDKEIRMFHCHMDDRMNAGMATLYKVEP